jgi:hypothetical protein
MEYFSVYSTVNVINHPNKGGFWSDYGSPPLPVAVQRLRDRAFFGAAAPSAPLRYGDPGYGWWVSHLAGANWAATNATVLSMADVGGVAVVGASRASDGEAVGSAAPIGVGGFLINDTAAAHAGWALYSDVQHQPVGADAASYGLEIAAKNKGNNSGSDPYGLGTGVYGIWVAGGGDNTYGGAATNPATAAMVILTNGQSGLTNGWNAGIVFQNGALTPIAGAGEAIVMPANTRISWYSAAGVRSTMITSAVVTSGAQVSLQFYDNLIVLSGINVGMLRLNNVANAANHLQIMNSATGSPILLNAFGTDTDIDLALNPKGAGNVRFGTNVIKAAEAFASYIVIKDSGGTPRKVMVCA